MSIIEKIKADQLTARKDVASGSNDYTQFANTVKAKLLTTLLGEIGLKTSDKSITITDNDVYAIINKFIKNCNETLKITNSEEVALEKTILESYLPQQLSTEQLVTIINEIKGKTPDTKMVKPAVMKFFKANYPNQRSESILPLI